MTEREKLLTELAAVEAGRASREAELPTRLESLNTAIEHHHLKMREAQNERAALLNVDAVRTQILSLRRELEKHTPEEIKDCWKKIHYQLWYLENELPVTSANRALILERRKILEDAERAAEELRFRIVDDLPDAVAKIMATIPKGQP